MCELTRILIPLIRSFVLKSGLNNRPISKDESSKVDGMTQIF